MSVGSYAVQCGAGGTGGIDGVTDAISYGRGNNGTPSYLWNGETNTGIGTAIGGGGGGYGTWSGPESSTYGPGNPGGSGGGGAAPARTKGSGTPGQGNNGGQAIFSGNVTAGGGGGSGGNGSSNTYGGTLTLIQFIQHQ